MAGNLKPGCRAFGTYSSSYAPPDHQSADKVNTPLAAAFHIGDKQKLEAIAVTKAIGFAKFPTPHHGERYAKLYTIEVDPPGAAHPKVDFLIGWELAGKELGDITEDIGGVATKIKVEDASYKQGAFAAGDKLGDHVAFVQVGGKRFLIRTLTPVR